MLQSQKNQRRAGDRTANAFARAALASTSLPSCSSTSYATIDPEAVAEEIFGASIDLEDRDAVLDLLESVLPLDADGTVSDSIVQRAAFTSAQSSATTSSGPYAPFYLTAQNLSAQGTLLKAIRPLSDYSRGNGCDYKTLIGLIQLTVSQLVSQAGQPDGPIGGTVNDLLGNLTGYTPGASTTFDVYTIGGSLGELRQRAGIEITTCRSRGDQGIVASFSSYVALAGAVVRAWDEVQATGGSEYLVVAESTVRRNLGGIESNLRRLRELVDDDAWLTTVLPTEPPMVAAKFYRWVSDYVSTQAPQILLAGEDGFASIALTMKSMAGHLSKGFISPATDPLVRLRAPIATAVQDCPDPGLGITDFELPGNVCEGIPFAFNDEEVTDIVKSTLCHVQQILDVAGSIAGTTAVVKHGNVVNADNQAIRWASQTDPVYVRACGNALESVPAYTRGEDGTECEAPYVSSFEGGVKYRLDLMNGKTGRNEIFVGRKLVADVVVIPATHPPHFEPGPPAETPTTSATDAPASDADASSPTKKSATAPKSKA